MKIFNSMNNRKETFESIVPNKISMYVCGPTVYNYIHIGNSRPMIVFDTFRRLFEYLGYEVTLISNFTDVDDKIIAKSKELNIPEMDIVEKYIAAYENDRISLNSITPEYQPRVTDYIEKIINFIETLVDKGFAYEVDGDVYFRVSKIDNYGNLSNFDKDNLQVGARIKENLKKENPLDFTLWKKTNDGINWPSKFSQGRPGWHTECIVIISDIFNSQMIDIHGGGMDLKFPHHENEIAQSEACYNHSIAKYWVHNGFINIDNEKMSKSLGNVKWTKDVVREIGSNAFRLAMLSTHYRSPLNFGIDLIDYSKKELIKIENVLKKANLELQINNINDKFFDIKNNTFMIKFISFLEDDLNTSNAITVILDTVKLLNFDIRAQEKNYITIAQSFSVLIKMLDILGISIYLKEFTTEDINMYNNWLSAKENKDYDKADLIRKRLLEIGIL